jgi:hypothetical protein
MHWEVEGLFSVGSTCVDQWSPCVMSTTYIQHDKGGRLIPWLHYDGWEVLDTPIWHETEAAKCVLPVIPELSFSLIVRYLFLPIPYHLVPLLMEHMFLHERTWHLLREKQSELLEFLDIFTTCGLFSSLFLSFFPCPSLLFCDTFSSMFLLS